MKRTKTLTTLGLVVCLQVFGWGQFLKVVHVELGVNRARVMNTDALFPSQEEVTIDIPHSELRAEYASYTNNYSMAVGIQLHRRHAVKLRISKNTLGSHLSGRFPGSDGFCGFGIQQFVMNNEPNYYTSTGLGLFYEFLIPTQNFMITAGIGAQKNRNNYNDVRAFVYSMNANIYSGRFYTGIMVPLTKYLHLHSMFFVDQSLDIFRNNEGRRYTPLLMGFEVGLRLQLVDY